MFYGFYWYQLCTEMIQPDLPNVLHNLNFENNPGEKVDFGSYDENMQFLRSVLFSGERGPERSLRHCHSLEL